MLVVRSLALAETREVESLFSFFRWSSQCQRCPSDGQHPRLRARCKAHRQTLDDVTIKNKFLILIIDSSY